MEVTMQFNGFPQYSRMFYVTVWSNGPLLLYTLLRRRGHQGRDRGGRGDQRKFDIPIGPRNSTTRFDLHEKRRRKAASSLPGLLLETY